jgi:hypothetical protein
LSEEGRAELLLDDRVPVARRVDVLDVDPGPEVLAAADVDLGRGEVLVVGAEEGELAEVGHPTSRLVVDQLVRVFEAARRDGEVLMSGLGRRG